MEAADYFTDQDFLDYLGVVTLPAPYTDEKVEAAQAEVVFLLEDWAMTGWPNVDGMGPDMGHADEARSSVETLASAQVLLLGHVPIIDVATLTIGGTEIDASGFDVHPDAGLIRFDTEPLELGLRTVVVDYSWGFTSTPLTIKRNVMAATKALLDGAPKGGAASVGKKGVPAGVRRWTTEQATFEKDGTSSSAFKLWPFAEGPAAEIVAYWSRHRPTRVLSGV